MNANDEKFHYLKDIFAKFSTCDTLYVQLMFFFLYLPCLINIFF